MFGSLIAASVEFLPSFGMQTQIEALKAENDRLRRDNERFVRIIDSGEWGRGRVAELVQVIALLSQFSCHLFR